MTDYDEVLYVKYLKAWDMVYTSTLIWPDGEECKSQMKIIWDYVFHLRAQLNLKEDIISDLLKSGFPL